MRFCVLRQAGKLVVIDEIHQAPTLFEVLRGIMDYRRAAGERPGHFLLLGSAAIELMHQASESLAGRVAYVNLESIDALELPHELGDTDRLWVRGGFPESVLASNDSASLEKLAPGGEIPHLSPVSGRRHALDTLRSLQLACHGSRICGSLQFNEVFAAQMRNKDQVIDMRLQLAGFKPRWDVYLVRSERLAAESSNSYRNSGSQIALLNEGAMLEDTKIPIRLKLSALWTALMFCYVYGDYFGLYPPGHLEGMLEGTGPLGPTSQSSLVAVSILMAIPSLMTFLPIVLPTALNRWLNFALALAYALVVAITMPGAWAFYLFFSAIEIALSLLIAWYAWRWPKAA
jgi:hypothetical protein